MRSFLLTLLVAAVCLSSCTKQTTRTVRLVVCNSNNYDVNGVVAGVSAQAVMDSLHIHDAQSIALFDEQGKPVVTQLFDNGEQLLLAFECSVLAQGEQAYTVQVGHPVDSPLLPIAEEMNRWVKEQAVDSLRPLLDIMTLGGSISPSANTSMPSPWDYKRFEVLAEGPLLCAYRLHYDTLLVNNDTLIEHRTLVMQQGTPLTIVRTYFENAGHQDTLLLFRQLAVKVPRRLADRMTTHPQESLKVVVRADSTVFGLRVQVPTLGVRNQQPAEEISENILDFSGYYLPCQPDSTVTFFVASSSQPGDPSAFNRIFEALQRLPDPPLTTRIVVQH